MMHTFSNKIEITFVITAILTLALVYNLLKNSNFTKKQTIFIIAGMTIWLNIQASLTLNNLYNTNVNSTPPKIFALGVFPYILLTLWIFFSKRGKEFIEKLSLLHLTLISIVRVPVELTLYWLFLEKAVPQIMTFEGQNFDILAGLTAPFIALFYFKKGSISNKSLLAWNIFCFGLLMNIVITAILAAPFTFQKIAFEQPNIAILNFPISLLPTFIVPIVFLSHLISIKKLITIKS